MRTLFIGLFILVFFAGIATQQMSHAPAGQTSWLRGLMNMTGLKHSDEVQKAQIKQIVHQGEDKPEDFARYLKDQQQALEDSRLQVSSLYQIIKDRSDRDTNVDLLRLKDLMKRYQDQSALLIEHGKQLMELNEDQTKMRQKLASQAQPESFFSNSQQQGLLQNFQDNLSRQRDLFASQTRENGELKDRAEQIRNQVQKMHDNVAFKEDSRFLEKLQSLSEKSVSVLDKVKEQQARLKDLNQENLDKMSSLAEKINDTKQRSADLVEDNRQRAQDQEQILKDHLRDQLDRIQDQRNK